MNAKHPLSFIRKQSIPISLGRLSRIEQTLWPNIASSPLCIFHAPLIGSNSRMLERMESPKLRSFEEVPYVEKRRWESHLSRTFFSSAITFPCDQSRDRCSVWPPLARSFNKLRIEFSRVHSI